jgi:hypothetical protein
VSYSLLMKRRDTRHFPLKKIIAEHTKMMNEGDGGETIPMNRFQLSSCARARVSLSFFLKVPGIADLYIIRRVHSLTPAVLLLTTLPGLGAWARPVLKKG